MGLDDLRPEVVKLFLQLYAVVVLLLYLLGNVKIAYLHLFKLIVEFLDESACIAQVKFRNQIDHFVFYKTGIS